jgi:hypothetical protein
MIGNQAGIVHPSPAERFYLEEHQRREQEWAWQQAEAARISAIISAQIAGHIDGTSLIGAPQGAQMHYEERTFDIGDVQVGTGLENRATVPIPGEFGTVLSFVATLSNGGSESADPRWDAPKWLWWSFETSVDGEHWLVIHAPGVTSSFLVGLANGAASTRQHGPFGNRLRLKIGGKRGYTVDDTTWLPCKWIGLRLSIGVQRI